ncbi:MAG: MoaD/ThiS family protein [Candidatus Freyarchaeum deiterrae]
MGFETFCIQKIQLFMGDSMKVEVQVMSSLKYIAKKSKMSFNMDNEATVLSLLNSILAVDKKLFNSILDHEGELNSGIIILVNKKDIEVLQGLNTKLQDGDTVFLLSAVHGG